MTGVGVERRAILVTGVVQSVGFRPFVHRVARSLSLSGHVRNHPDGVWIEVEGTRGRIDALMATLAREPPFLARIDGIETRVLEATGDARPFEIRPSSHGDPGLAFVAPDVATCDECLAETLSPGERRHGYAFTTCTNCGPRFTIMAALPYDRAATTMEPFPLCADCAREYGASGDRRFHAQAVACARCGPHLSARRSDWQPIDGVDPMTWAAQHLDAGGILGVKGLGGFHLACDATNARAVARLRARKERSRKPFAVMVRPAELERLFELRDGERAALHRPDAPILLARPRPTSRGAELAAAVAPGSRDVGVMLPYTPLHHLLVRAVTTPVLVMTSGNRSGEPITYRDEDAARLLGDTVVGFLSHDRRILVHCDDSVVREVAGVITPVRRSRGQAPIPIRVPGRMEVHTLAVGAHMKGSFGLARASGAGPARVVLSHHLGDLETAAAVRNYRRAVEHFEALYRVRPQRIVHDRHPDYVTTRYALERAARAPDIELVAVQHHHAHFAACLADAGAEGDAIGVCFDGSGFGDDGTVWGGEWLVGNAATSQRRGHLRCVPLPGGTRAILEPWRMALSHVLAAGIDPRSVRGLREIPAATLATLETSMERGVNAPLTSSVGRLFDAVAALLGLCAEVTFDGEAAQLLESAGTGDSATADVPFAIHEPGGATGLLELDPRPAIAAIVAAAEGGASPGGIARSFHLGLARAVASMCRRLRADTGLEQVALSGGVWINRILMEATVSALEECGFRVLRHRLVPPNDGGLGFGQLATVAARDALRHHGGRSGSQGGGVICSRR